MASKRKRAPRTGFVFYRGPSMIDGKPIVGIVTLKSSNVKTGNVLQTWVVRSHIDPLRASKQGDDVSICGDCPMRHHTGGACYVNIGQAPGGVYKAYKRGRYPALDLRLTAHRKAIAGRVLRAGSYGDPAAIPMSAWNRLRRRTTRAVGYTHQWRHINVHAYGWLMASCDSVQDAQDARAAGWRYFRAQAGPNDAEPESGSEIYCPAERGVTCEQCKLCGGNDARGKRDIVIKLHGSWLPAGHEWNHKRKRKAPALTTLTVGGK